MQQDCDPIKYLLFWYCWNIHQGQFLYAKIGFPLLLQLQLQCVGSNSEIFQCGHLSKKCERMAVRIKDDRKDNVVWSFLLHDAVNNGLREDINGISSSKTNFELHVRYRYGFWYLYSCDWGCISGMWQRFSYIIKDSNHGRNIKSWWNPR